MNMKNKGALTVAVLAVLAAVLMICVLSVKKVSGGGYGAAMFDFSFGGSAALRNTIELPLSDVDRLKLIYGSKNIKFYPGEDERIIIKEYLYSDLPQAKAEVESSGEREVTVTGGTVHTLVFFGFGIGGGERIEVYVPKGALSSLAVQNGSGNVRGEHLCVCSGGDLAVSTGSGNIDWSSADTGNASFQAGSGNIKFADISGNVSIQTGSGNISGNYLEGNFDISAGSGNIRLTWLNGGGRISAHSGNIHVKEASVWEDISLKTGSGNIDVEMSGGTGNISMQSGSGGLKLRVPEGLKFYFEAQVGSGSIYTDFDNDLSYNQRGNSAQGEVGDDPQITVRLKSNSGSIRVLR